MIAGCAMDGYGNDWVITRRWLVLIVSLFVIRKSDSSAILAYGPINNHLWTQHSYPDSWIHEKRWGDKWQCRHWNYPLKGRDDPFNPSWLWMWFHNAKIPHCTPTAVSWQVLMLQLAFSCLLPSEHHYQNVDVENRNDCRNQTPINIQRRIQSCCLFIKEIAPRSRLIIWMQPAIINIIWVWDIHRGVWLLWKIQVMLNPQLQESGAI